MCQIQVRAGHEYFKRYFFPQANKAGIIVDERFNGGGQLADYYIDLLKRPVQSYWRYRYGKDQKAPNASIQGPKVMLIDETAGSGGDYLPYFSARQNWEHWLVKPHGADWLEYSGTPSSLMVVW